jgi:hypothetical protein
LEVENEMGILSIFKKPAPEEIYEEIASRIILSSFQYRSDLCEDNNMLSTDAGAEFAYLLLHIVDRAAFELFGPKHPEEIFEEISKIVIADYCKSAFAPDTPKAIVSDMAVRMFNNLNKRQLIYSQCTSVIGKPPSFPAKGTMVFALGYFVNFALQRTSRTNVDEILCGHKDITKDDLKDFPSFEQTTTLAIHIGTVIGALGIKDLLKKLRI